METKELLQKLSTSVGVSGYEERVTKLLMSEVKHLVDEIHSDTLGNLVLCRRGTGAQPRMKVMLAAHIDEIGLVITKIEEQGFLRFAPMGGVDQRVLPGQEVIVHGTSDLAGVIGAKPPHIQDADEAKSAYKMEDLYIDVGLTLEQAQAMISVGDMVTLRRDFLKLQGSLVAGKAMDDRAGVVTMVETLKYLSKLHHQADVFAVATVQEEVGVRGAVVSTFGIVPDIGIAIDVGHGDMPGVPKSDTLPLGKGPGVGWGPHVHPKIFHRLTEVAQKWNIDYSVEVANTPQGTDAYAIQVTQAGIPTALISLPLRYMHTPVETLDFSDVEKAGRLLALFIAELTPDWVEGLRCF